jgi:ribosomal peptide maturation radical SAM protein 1
MTSPKQSPGPWRVALVAMPWQLFNRPSIQLATLKAYLERHAGDWLQVDLFHPYLAVARLLGPELYHRLSLNPWAGEALYAPLLFPDQEPEARKLLNKALRRAAEPVDFDFAELRQKLDQHLSQWLAETDWRKYGLIGFSICFHQLLSSLTAASRLKELFPTIPIAIGGSFCAPPVAASLLNGFPALDYRVHGEGEQPLLDLCRFLTGRRESLPAAVAGRGEELQTESLFCQVAELSELPAPDYQGYFAELKRQFAKQSFIPTLPVEFSRGCWWGKCAFCNLNLQWRGYRAKNSSRMLEEVLSLAVRYNCLDFAFTDNALPPKEARFFFQEMAASGQDLRFFGEIRVQHRQEELETYRRGGLDTVQVGIEALSNSLLRKMGKGVSVFDNIAAMKHSLAAGMLLEGNLITEFPGSTFEEVEETLCHLDFVLPFPPLSAASFFLGHGSPVELDPGRYSIGKILAHPNYRGLFPKEVLSGLTLLIKDYRGDRSAQRKQWLPVVEKIKDWQRFHARRKDRRRWQFPLSYREGSTFLLIRQELLHRTLHHRLRGVSREIYLFCEQGRHMRELHEKFPSLAEAKLRDFLEGLSYKRLIFSENDRFLSLAIRSN